VTRRLKAGRDGAGGITEAEAIAAMNEWREYGSDARFTPLSPAGATPESYLLTVTPVLTAGVYRLIPIMFATGSQAGTQLQMDLTIDAVPIGPILTEASVNGGGFLLSSVPDQDWTAGDAAHTFEFLIAQPGGPGTVTARVASFSWERVA
jgi:hypothetical protein